MKKRYVISIIAIFIILLSFFAYNDLSKKEIIDNKTIGIYLQDENDENNYVLSELHTIPTDEYVFNVEKTNSLCSGVNFTYDEETNNISLLTNKSVKCNLYFDKVKLSIIGQYYLLLTDGNTYKYNKDGNLLKTIATNGKFTVEYTAKYSIELHGGGGGGSSGSASTSSGGNGYTYGADGGGSGNIFDNYLLLQKNDIYDYNVGQGGAGTATLPARQSNWLDVVCYDPKVGEKGGTTTFGNYSLSGGGGGSITGLCGDTQATNGSSIGNVSSGISGGSTIGNYGNGGNRGYGYNYKGEDGQPGAIIIRITDM